MKKETVKTLVIIVLGALVLAFYLDEKCVIDWIPSTCSVDTIIKTDTVVISNPVGHCDDASRYNATSDVIGGGRIINSNDAHAMMSQFDARFHIAPQRGVVISKRALDNMFDRNETFNSIGCYFALDNGKIKLLFEPLSTEANIITVPGEPTIPENNIFITEGFCPAICGSVLGN